MSLRIRIIISSIASLEGNRVAKNIGFKGHRPDGNTFLAQWPWISSRTFLGLRFLISKVGMIRLLTYFCCGVRRDNSRKGA